MPAPAPTPTPAALIEQLRIDLGEPGQPLSDDRLAELVGAPTRQQVIGWRKHGRGMSRKYAERFSELSRRTGAPRPPEDYLSPAVVQRVALSTAVSRLEEMMLEFHTLLAAVSAQVGEIQQTQTLIRERLELPSPARGSGQSAPGRQRAEPQSL